MILGVPRETKPEEYRVAMVPACSSDDAFVLAGAVPRISTLALTSATLPYIRRIANLGLDKALEEMPSLKQGINTYCKSTDAAGSLTCEPVALSQGREHVSLEDIHGS